MAVARKPREELLAPSTGGSAAASVSSRSRYPGVSPARASRITSAVRGPIPATRSREFAATRSAASPAAIASTAAAAVRKAFTR